jgi:hypothetical protein
MVWITGWFTGLFTGWFTWWLTGSAYGVLDSSRNYTHKLENATTKVINLRRTEIIEAKKSFRCLQLTGRLPKTVLFLKIFLSRSFATTNLKSLVVAKQTLGSL